MKRRSMLMAAAAAALSRMLPAPARAQTEPNTPDTITVPVDQRGYHVTIPQDQPLALYVESTGVTPYAQIADSIVFVNVAEIGFQQMTPCDNVTVLCRSVPIRMEGITQGEQFYLDMRAPEEK